MLFQCLSLFSTSLFLIIETVNKVNKMMQKGAFVFHWIKIEKLLKLQFELKRVRLSMSRAFGWLNLIE